MLITFEGFDFDGKWYVAAEADEGENGDVFCSDVSFDHFPSVMEIEKAYNEILFNLIGKVKRRSIYLTNQLNANEQLFNQLLTMRA